MQKNHVMQMTQEIKRQIAFVCAFEPESIRDDAWLIEYGLDSMRSLDLVITLETHFGIELPNEEIGSLVTVSDVVNLVQRRMAVS